LARPKQYHGFVTGTTARDKTQINKCKQPKL